MSGLASPLRRMQWFSRVDIVVLVIENVPLTSSQEWGQAEVVGVAHEQSRVLGIVDFVIR